MTSVDPGRRAFLRGRVRQPAGEMLMPWRADDFLSRCQRCDDCVKACPEGIVRRGDGGFPRVDFAFGGCTFCAVCVDACRHGALERAAEAPWQVEVTIGAACLGRSGVTCRCCGESCDAGAIRFRLAIRGRSIPEVSMAACTGCGACVSSCPVQAVAVEPLPGRGAR
jgi:ferredoxin-type protein NapF